MFFLFIILPEGVEKGVDSRHFGSATKLAGKKGIERTFEQLDTISWMELVLKSMAE